MHACREMSTGEQSLYTDGGHSEMLTRGNLWRSGDIARPSDFLEGSDVRRRFPDQLQTAELVSYQCTQLVTMEDQQ